MITSLGADEMEWRRLTRERERERPDAKGDALFTVMKA